MKNLIAIALLLLSVIQIAYAASPTASVVVASYESVSEIVWRNEIEREMYFTRFTPSSNTLSATVIKINPPCGSGYDFQASSAVFTNNGTGWFQKLYKFTTIASCNTATNVSTNGNWLSTWDYPISDDWWELCKFKDHDLGGLWGINAGDGLWAHSVQCTAFQSGDKFSREAKTKTAVKLVGGGTNKLFWVELEVHVYEIGVQCPYLELARPTGTEIGPTVYMGASVPDFYRIKVNSRYVEDDHKVKVQCRGDSLTDLKLEVLDYTGGEHWLRYTITPGTITEVVGLSPNYDGEIDGGNIASLEVEGLISVPAATATTVDKGFEFVHSSGTVTGALVRDNSYGMSLSSTANSTVIIDSNNDDTTAYFRVKNNTLNPNTGTTLFAIDENGTVTALSSVGAIQFVFNQNSIKIATGTGAPTVPHPNGSIYLRSDGTGPNLYVRQNGVWVAK